MSYKEEFIEFMVESGALTFGDFTTKSGRKSPYFINTGRYKTGEQIRRLDQFYGACIMENIRAGKLDEDITALFGPAYKGIPIAVAAAIALASDHRKNVNFCFNRKEAKDHGEGGVMVGYSLQDGDSVLMVEDVMTAGTAVRETLPILKKQANINICGLVISVDRMEKGPGGKTAALEIKEEFGIKTIAIVTVREVLAYLHGRKIDGKEIISDQTKEQMEKYMAQYTCEELVDF